MEGLGVDPDPLAFHFRALAELRVALPRLDEDRHDVRRLAARVSELLEPPLHLRHVPRRLEAPDPVDLLELDGFVDPQVRDRARFRHHVLRSEEHTSELQSPCNLVCRLLLEKKKNKLNTTAVNAIR